MKLKDYVKKLNEILKAYEEFGEFQALTYDYEVKNLCEDFVLGWFYDDQWIREGDGRIPPKDKPINAIMF